MRNLIQCLVLVCLIATIPLASAASGEPWSLDRRVDFLMESSGSMLDAAHLITDRMGDDTPRTEAGWIWSAHYKLASAAYQIENLALLYLLHAVNASEASEEQASDLERISQQLRTSVETERLSIKSLIESTPESDLRDALIAGRKTLRRIHAGWPHQE